MKPNVIRVLMMNAGIIFNTCFLVTPLFALAPDWTPAWTKTLNPGGFTSVRAIETDSLGNLYVAGGTDGLFGSQNFPGTNGFVLKFAPNGTQLWARQFDMNFHTVTGLSVDNSGNVIAVGQIAVGQTTGASFIRKLNPSGTTLWSTTFTSQYRDDAFGVASDSVGNIFVSGQRATSVFSREDAFLKKYDPSGNFVWDRVIATPGREQGRDVAVDSLGNIIVVGGTTGDLVLPVQGEIDAFVTKFDQAGNVLLTNQYQGAGEAAEVDTDNAGNTYVSGYSGNGTSGFVMKLRSNGTRHWNRVPPDSIVAGHVSADGLGNVYASGYDERGEAYLAHYSDGGALLSMHFPTELDLSNGWGPYIAADGGRSLFAVNSFLQQVFIARYDIVPEPASIVLMAGLGSLLAGRFRR